MKVRRLERLGRVSLENNDGLSHLFGDDDRRVAEQLDDFFSIESNQTYGRIMYCTRRGRNFVSRL